MCHFFFYIRKLKLSLTTSLTLLCHGFQNRGFDYSLGHLGVVLCWAFSFWFCQGCEMPSVFILWLV